VAADNRKNPFAALTSVIPEEAKEASLRVEAGRTKKSSLTKRKKGCAGFKFAEKNGGLPNSGGKRERKREQRQPSGEKPT